MKPISFVTPLRQLIVGHMRYRFRFNFDPAVVRVIEQSENIKQSALATAGRTDHGVNAAGFELERNSAQRVHARFLFAEVTLNFLDNSDKDSYARSAQGCDRWEFSRAPGGHVAGDEYGDESRAMLPRR